MKPTILITGGTGKFGRKFVDFFYKKGWEVLFTSTSNKRGEDFIAELGHPDNVVSLEADFSTSSGVGELLKGIWSSGRKVNHLVNNARNLSTLSINERGQAGREDFVGEYVMDVVVPYEISMALMNEQGHELETITNIGSQYGLVAANPGLYDDYLHQSPIQYGVAKSALIHLTKELAVRMANSDVRVNCIAYGGVEGRVDEGFKDRYSKLSPNKRMLTESEVVGPLAFLVSDASSAMTGATIVADGGWSIW